MARKGGFTLVEMIVTLVIAIIIIGVSGSLIITGTNIFTKSAQKDRQMDIAETVLSFAVDRLLYAESISERTPSPTGASAGYAGAQGAVLHIINPDTNTGGNRGQLYFRRAGDSGYPVNVFGAGFYHNYLVAINYDIERPGSGGASVTVTVTLYNSSRPEEAVAERSSTKPLLNYTGEAKTLGGSTAYIDIY